MTTALIADDEPKLAQDLGLRLRRCWPEMEIVATVGDGLQAVAELGRLKPQFSFLDIRMPGLSGIEVAAAARETRIVFVTAFEEYAVAAFDAAAVDYLLKPFTDARLAQCVLRLQQCTTPDADFGALLSRLERREPVRHLSWLRTGLGSITRLVSVREVLYFHAAEKYTEVVTLDERHLIRTSLRELVERLDPEQFAQIRRSTIVNLNAIERIERDVFGRSELLLKGHSDVLEVSRAYSGRFRQM